jgi:hypothetical protein
MLPSNQVIFITLRARQQTPGGIESTLDITYCGKSSDHLSNSLFCTASSRFVSSSDNSSVKSAIFPFKFCTLSGLIS